MTRQTDQSPDLQAMARQIMRDAGFHPILPREATLEIESISEKVTAVSAGNDIRDLRTLLWSSIDNADSRDLDQIEYAEALPDGGTRMLVGIADVDIYVRKDSAIDRHALANATSVYTGIATFPMLPDELSAGLTSLLPDVDRLAVVTELTLNDKGEVKGVDAYRALVRNHAKLVYEPVGAWLERHGPIPAEVGRIPGLREQVLLQYDAMELLELYRKREGALNFETPEARPITVNGHVVDIIVREQNEAQEMIEDAMVATNNATAEFLRSRGYPAIQRVVREPEQWPSIVKLARKFGDKLPDRPDSPALAAFMLRQRIANPKGYSELSFSIIKLIGASEYVVVAPGEPSLEHFSLALRGYARTTAPNRRYIDLITQRLLKAAIIGAPSPYTLDELAEIARHCRDRERIARKVERQMRKSAAAILIGDRIGQLFNAIVTGVKPRGTFVRVTNPPVEGKVVRGERRMQVGQKVKVRLIGINADRGFIDFEGV
jgi:exoribonuclease-2